MDCPRRLSNRKSRVASEKVIGQAKGYTGSQLLTAVFPLFSPLFFFFEHIPDDFQNGIHIVHDIMVPEPQNSIAPSFQILRSFIIFFLFQVLTLI